MITRLQGIVIEKQPPELVVDIQGVGYNVMVPMTTYYQLPESGESVTLHTHFHVREDAQQLFGFAEKKDRTLFQDLIKVNGIGAKMGLAILSGMDSQSVVRCILDGDVPLLTSIPGIGKKTAERIVIDMKDRLNNWLQEYGQEEGNAAQAEALLNIAESNSQAYEDALSALTALGYKPAEAKKAVTAQLNTDAGASSETLIRSALRQLVKR